MRWPKLNETQVRLDRRSAQRRAWSSPDPRPRHHHGDGGRQCRGAALGADPRRHGRDQFFGVGALARLSALFRVRSSAR